MKIRLKSLTLRLDPLMLCFPCIAVVLGSVRMVMILLISLLTHEFAHWITARAAGIIIPTIRLTPFGGYAQMDNPYAFPPHRLCLVAAAGPCGNLLLVLLSAALCHARIIPDLFAAECIRINLTLILFNLLPALPLDGGRILYSLLCPFMRDKTALNICIWSGRTLALLMCVMALAGFVRYRQLNLSLLFAAVFILTSASDERRALTYTRAQSVFNTLRPLTRPTPVHLIAIDSDCPPLTALQATRPDRITLFALYKNGRLQEFTDDRTLVERVLEEPPQPLSAHQKS